MISLSTEVAPKAIHTFTSKNKPVFPAFLDNTSLRQFRRCPKSGYWYIHRKVVTESTSIHLHAGAAYALGLEVVRKCYFNHKLPIEVALAEGARAMVIAFGDFDCPPYINKTIDRLVGALAFYFEAYPIDKGLVPFLSASGAYGIEYNFAVPLPIDHPDTGEPILYTGRLDMLGEYRGNIFVEDDKTTSQLGQRWHDQWPLASGMQGYTWGCRQSGIPVAGALVRGISLLKNGYDTAEAPLFMPDWVITRWYDNTLLTIERIIKDYKSGNWEYALSDACSMPSKCSYYELCTSSNPESYLPISFKPNTWNPLDKQS